jgi:tripartite-type tricarboxylate transporter receptor subunit TctC
MKHPFRSTLILSLALSAPFAVQAQNWEPTKNVEFIIPAGTGGGADQMARRSRALSPSTT